MPDTIIGASWYTADQVAAALGLPIDIVRRFFDAMVADKRVAVAYLGDRVPALNGFTIMALVGRAQQQEQAQPKPMVSKRRHARQ